MEIIFLYILTRKNLAGGVMTVSYTHLNPSRISSGEISSPYPVYVTGISPPFSKHGEETINSFIFYPLPKYLRLIWLMRTVLILSYQRVLLKAISWNQWIEKFYLFSAAGTLSHAPSLANTQPPPRRGFLSAGGVRALRFRFSEARGD